MTSINEHTILTSFSKIRLNYDSVTDDATYYLRSCFAASEFRRSLLYIVEAFILSKECFVTEPGNSRLLHALSRLAKGFHTISNCNETQSFSDHIDELFQVAVCTYAIIRADSYYTNQASLNSTTRALKHVLLESLIVYKLEDKSSSLNEYVTCLHYALYYNEYPAHKIYSDDNLTNIPELNDKFKSFGVNEALTNGIPLTETRAEAMTSLSEVGYELARMKGLLISSVCSTFNARELEQNFALSGKQLARERIIRTAALSGLLVVSGPLEDDHSRASSDRD